MSQALNPTTINPSGQSTLTIPGDVGQYTAIDIYNASIFDLQVSGLPQGSIWLPMNAGVVLDPSKGLPAVVYFTPGQTTTLTPTPNNTVLTTLFLQGEPHPDYGAYVNTRYTNVGGGVTVTNPDRIVDPSDSIGVQVLDNVPFSYVLLEPTTNTRGIMFQTIDALNAHYNMLFLDPGGSKVDIFPAAATPANNTTFMQSNLNLSAVVTSIAGNPTAGLTGVAAVVAKQITTGITSTANQVIINYAPAVAGIYRANCFVRVNNGVSGNNLTVQVTFASGFGTGAANDSFLLTSGGLGPLRADGTVSIANSAFYYGASAPFYAATGTNIVINYRDPTNTPSDSIAALIEFLG